MQLAREGRAFVRTRLRVRRFVSAAAYDDAARDDQTETERGSGADPSVEPVESVPRADAEPVSAMTGTSPAASPARIDRALSVRRAVVGTHDVVALFEDNRALSVRAHGLSGRVEPIAAPVPAARV